MPPNFFIQRSHFKKHTDKTVIYHSLCVTKMHNHILHTSKPDLSIMW